MAGTFTKFSRQLGKRQRKQKRKFSKGLGKSLKKRKTGSRSIYNI